MIPGTSTHQQHLLRNHHLLITPPYHLALEFRWHRSLSVPVHSVENFLRFHTWIDENPAFAAVSTQDIARRSEGPHEESRQIAGPSLAAGAWNPAEENATKAQTKGLREADYFRSQEKTETRLAEKEGINSSRAHPPTEGKALVNRPGCSRLRFCLSF